MFLAADINVKKPAKNAGLVDDAGNFAGTHIDTNGVFLVAINDGRDEACAACRTGGPLTDPFALFSANGCIVRHC
jgi:outer membrane usher protein FimD/PapC